MAGPSAGLPASRNTPVQGPSFESPPKQLELVAKGYLKVGTKECEISQLTENNLAELFSDNHGQTSRNSELHNSIVQLNNELKNLYNDIVALKRDTILTKEQKDKLIIGKLSNWGNKHKNLDALIAKINKINPIKFKASIDLNKQMKQTAKNIQTQYDKTQQQIEKNVNAQTSTPTITDPKMKVPSRPPPSPPSTNSPTLAKTTAVNNIPFPSTASSPVDPASSTAKPKALPNRPPPAVPAAKTTAVNIPSLSLTDAIQKLPAGRMKDKIAEEMEHLFADPDLQTELEKLKMENHTASLSIGRHTFKKIDEGGQRKKLVYEKDDEGHIYVRLPVHLGEGSSKKVKVVLDLSSNIFYAQAIAKTKYTTNVEKLERKEEKLKNERERELLIQRVDGPNVVKIRHVSNWTKTNIEGETSARIGIMQELCDGTLESLIENKLSPNNSERKDLLPKIVQQLIDGAIAMEKAKINHSDIKPANILFRMENDSPTLKYADFGTAEQLEEGKERESIAGSPLYTSPELASAFNKLEEIEQNSMQPLESLTTLEEKLEEKQWLSPEEKKQKGILEAQVTSLQTEQNKLFTKIATTKTDVWAMGLTFYQLEHGGQLPGELQVYKEKKESLEKQMDECYEKCNKECDEACRKKKEEFKKQPTITDQEQQTAIEEIEEKYKDKYEAETKSIKEKSTETQQELQDFLSGINQETVDSWFPHPCSPIEELTHQMLTVDLEKRPLATELQRSLASTNIQQQPSSRPLPKPKPQPFSGKLPATPQSKQETSQISQPQKPQPPGQSPRRLISNPNEKKNS